VEVTLSKDSHTVVWIIARLYCITWALSSPGLHETDD